MNSKMMNTNPQAKLNYLDYLINQSIS